MAIDDLLDEHEQSERVRSWLRNNALGLLGGVALGLGVIVGWQWFQKHRAQQEEQSYQAYQKANQQISAGDLKKAEAAVASIGGKDKNAVYSELAGLRLAKAQVEAGKHEAAIATLRAIQHDPALQPLVNARLARLLIDTGKPAEAVKVLGEASDPFSLEIRGDALHADGKPEQARESYNQALVGMDVAAPQRRLLELKLAEVGGTIPASGDKA